MDGQPKNFTRSTRPDQGGDGLTSPGTGDLPVDDAPWPAAGPAAGPIPDPFDEDTPRTPDWFKTAVFYEVSVRGFADSNNDGYGDLRGLISKLDHLQWLGVDCLWLLPIYQSPLKDGGYDIANYTSILPDFGELGDFVELIEQAHARGIRVIADLVMNHTSDQHPWFQASRTDPDGPFGDFY
ncbi:alpha-amylase family glycosyl hydrolase, partial [Actinomadura sp. NPDC049753]|uniref:alpha-amylase family glycosyl hydrolase n=1 Tax=Actinomadura sp. NPDC049753 TaxID=3154739 RepID=UPI00341B1D92